MCYKSIRLPHTKLYLAGQVYQARLQANNCIRTNSLQRKTLLMYILDNENCQVNSVTNNSTFASKKNWNGLLLYG